MTMSYKARFREKFERVNRVSNEVAVQISDKFADPLDYFEQLLTPEKISELKKTVDGRALLTEIQKILQSAGRQGGLE